jgi:transcriptional regulator with XRE-family HTH domain
MSDGTSHSARPLAELVRERRKALDLTEYELAERCGWSDAYGTADVRSLESGEIAFPSASQIEALAEALELDSETIDRAVNLAQETSSDARSRASVTVELGTGRRVRHMPPDGVEDEEALRAWAAELSQMHGRPVTLTLDGDHTCKIRADAPET